MCFGEICLGCQICTFLDLECLVMQKENPTKHTETKCPALNVQWGSGHWCPLDIDVFKASSLGNFGFPKTPGGGPVWQKPTPPQRETWLRPWERTSRVFHRPGSSTRRVVGGGYVGPPAGGSQDTRFGHSCLQEMFPARTPAKSRGNPPILHTGPLCTTKAQVSLPPGLQPLSF